MTEDQALLKSQKTFALIGTDAITGKRYARSAPDANHCLRENIRAHMAVWSSTATQISRDLGLNESDFQRFLDGTRGADLDWVTRIAAYTGMTPAQVLVDQTANARANVLAHLELVAEGDDLQSMLETLIVAKRCGLLREAIEVIGSLSDIALSAEGEDPNRVRTLARQITAGAER